MLRRGGSCDVEMDQGGHVRRPPLGSSLFLDPAQVGMVRAMSAWALQRPRKALNMRSDFTFPLALCKAQWSIALRMLAWLETCGAQGLALGAHLLDDRSETTRADAQAVSSAEDWEALAVLAAGALGRAVARPATTPADVPHARAGAGAAEVLATGSPPPRQYAVDDALRTLRRALDPPARPRHAGGTGRGKA